MTAIGSGTGTGGAAAAAAETQTAHIGVGGADGPVTRVWENKDLLGTVCSFLDVKV